MATINGIIKWFTLPIFALIQVATYGMAYVVFAATIYLNLHSLLSNAPFNVMIFLTFVIGCFGLLKGFIMLIKNQYNKFIEGLSMVVILMLTLWTLALFSLMGIVPD